MELSDPLIRVPFEQVNKSFRITQKHITKQLMSLIMQLSEIGVETQRYKSRAEWVAFFDEMEEQIIAMKACLHKRGNEQLESLECCMKRLQYLDVLRGTLSREVSKHKENDEISQAPLCETLPFTLSSATVHSDNCGIKVESETCYSRENCQALLYDRLISDYMLCRGYLKSANIMRKRHDLQDLIDYDLHLELQCILHDLKGQQVSSAITWCSENGSRLRRLNPPCMMEFRLRLQEFFGLVRIKSRLEAIHYAQTHLTSLALQQEDESARNAAIIQIQEAMATLAYEDPVNSGISLYSNLYSIKRWQDLEEEFRHTFFKAYGIWQPQLLCIALFAGLASLNTQTCEEVRRARTKFISEERATWKNIKSDLKAKRRIARRNMRRRDATNMDGPGVDQFAERREVGIGEKLKREASFVNEFDRHQPESRARGLVEKKMESQVPEFHGKHQEFLKDLLEKKMISRLMSWELEKSGQRSKHTCDGKNSAASYKSRKLSSYKQWRKCWTRKFLLPPPLCPTCSHIGEKLCDRLPLASHPHSRLICRITGTIIDENNPPFVLPNGFVYSQNAISKLAITADTSNIKTVAPEKIICLETNEEYSINELKPVYII